MSHETDITERLNARLDQFHKEAHIWPPGRDMPAEMCGDGDAGDLRFRAWDQWCRDKAEIERMRAACRSAKKCIAGLIPFNDNSCGPIVRAAINEVADKALAVIQELNDALPERKLTGCETTTGWVIEKPASRHGERDDRDR